MIFINPELKINITAKEVIIDDIINFLDLSNLTLFIYKFKTKNIIILIILFFNKIDNIINI